MGHNYLPKTSYSSEDERVGFSVMFLDEFFL